MTDPASKAPCWLSADVGTRFGVPIGENVRMSDFYGGGSNVPPSADVPSGGMLRMHRISAASNLTTPMPLAFNFDATYSTLAADPAKLGAFVSNARSNLAAKLALPAQAVAVDVAQSGDDGIVATAVVNLPFNNARKAAASNAVIAGALSTDPAALFGADFATMYLDTATVATRILAPPPIFSVPTAVPMGSVRLASNAAVFTLADYFADASPLVYTLAQNPFSNAALLSQPGNASILRVTGAARGSDYTVVVRATNSFGASATSALAVTEAAPGESVDTLGAPSVAAPLGAVTLSSTVATYDLGDYFTDIPAAHPLRYTVTANPVGSASLINGGDVLVVKGKNSGATYTVAVACTNAYGKSASNVLQVTEPAPSAPTVSAPLGSVTLGTGTATYALSDHFSDASGLPLAYSITRNPRGSASITGAGVLRVTGRGRGTSYTVAVTAANVFGASVSSSLAVTETLGGLSPGASSMGSVTVAAGVATYTLADYFTDPSGLGIAYALTANPHCNASLDPVRGLLTVTGASRGATYTVTVTGATRYGTAAASLQVTELREASPAAAPTASSMGAAALDGTGTLAYPLAGYFGGTGVSYELAANPRGNARISGGVLYVTGAFRAATYEVTVRGSNALGSATSSITVTEPSGAPVLLASRLAPVTLTSDTATIPLSGVFSDPTGAGLVYGLLANPALSAKVVGGALVVAGVLRGTSYTVVVGATNAYGTAAASLDVTEVTEVAEVAVLAPFVSSNLGAVSLSNDSATLSLAGVFGGTRPIDYSLLANPEKNADLTAGGVLTVTGAWRGKSYDVVLGASNPGGIVSATLAVTEALLLPFVASNLGAVTLSDNTVTLQLAGMFGGTPPLLYSLKANPYSNAALSDDVLSVVGHENDASYDVVIDASNRGGSASATLHVQEHAAQLFSFSTFTFDNINATSSYGAPNLTAYQMNATYAATPWAATSNFFMYNGYNGYQALKVPKSGTFTAYVNGARGGKGGGKGAQVMVTLSLKKNDTIVMVCGNTPPGHSTAGGGGGGMTVLGYDDGTNNFQVIAVGGGGGGYYGTAVDSTVLSLPPTSSATGDKKAPTLGSYPSTYPGAGTLAVSTWTNNAKSFSQGLNGAWLPGVSEIPSGYGSWGGFGGGGHGGWSGASYWGGGGGGWVGGAGPTGKGAPGGAGTSYVNTSLSTVVQGYTFTPANNAGAGYVMLVPPP